MIWIMPDKFINSGWNHTLHSFMAASSQERATHTHPAFAVPLINAGAGS